MPALVTGAEAAALLAACDRTTAQGLRDYAIVLTLTRMGLRAGEIAALTIEDVDWRSGIVVISGKGGRRDQLPFPATSPRRSSATCGTGGRAPRLTAGCSSAASHRTAA